MRAFLLVATMLTITLSGCIDDGPGVQTVPASALDGVDGTAADLALDATDDAEMYGLRTSPQATVTYERTQSDDDTAKIFDVDFLGIAPTYDEWGRTVPAWHFRVDEERMRPKEGLDVRDINNWESYDVERYRMFDAADGRSIGVVMPELPSRGFADPESRSPSAGPLMEMVAVKVWQTFGGYAEGGAWMRYEPDGSGDGCTIHRLVIEDDPDREGIHDYIGYDEPPTWRMCLDAGDAPLWMEAGDDEWVRWDRVGAGLALPDFDGDILEPHNYDRHDFDTIPSLVPLVADLHAFPAASDSDWAGRVQARAAAMMMHPDYIQYALDREGTYVHKVNTGWPVRPVFNEPWWTLGFTDHSWIMVTDGEGFFWGFVYSREAGEQEELHVADRGVDFTTLSSTPYPVLADFADGVVRIADPVDRMPAHIPSTPTDISLQTWPKFDDPVFDYIELPTTFAGVGTCFGDEPDDRFAMIDAVDGHYQSIGLAQKHSTESEDGLSYAASCSYGGEGALVPRGMEPMQVIQRYVPGDVQSVLRLPDGSLLGS